MSLIFNCEDALPAITGWNHCEPNYKFGEIEAVIISHISLPEGGDVYPTSITSTDDWQALFDADVAFLLPTRGTLAAPEQTVLDASGGRKAYPPAEFTIDARIDDLGDNVYASLKQYRNKIVRMWFIAGGGIFGGDTGISPVTVNTSLVIEEGFDTMHNLTMNLVWKAEEIPDRDDAPQFALSPEDSES